MGFILCFRSIGEFHSEKGIEQDSVRELTKIHVSVDAYDPFLTLVEACA